MLVALFSLLLGVTASESLPELGGMIQGTVVNGTRNNQPLEGVEVVMCAGDGGELVPVAETKTDRYGHFSFDQVPLDPTIIYLPGANHDGVHYPGQRVRLNQNSRVAHIDITVFDAVATPCPLVATRHHIDVSVEEQVLKVTEELSISNPTRATFVGQPMEYGPPVTFWLSIPKDFDRVTFDKEFYGRRFVVVDHRPVTEMPWLPGKQQLRYTYRIPLAANEGWFRRTLDIPSNDVLIRVRGADNQQVTCNLPRLAGSEGSAEFAVTDQRLAADFAIELQIAALPFPWRTYAPWAAVAILTALAVTTALLPSVRRRLSQGKSLQKGQQSPSRKRAA